MEHQENGSPPWNTVLEGDVSSVLPDLRACGLQFDLAICDPPYNIGKDFGNNRDRMPLDEYLDWSEEWLGTTLDLLAPQSPLYLYGMPEVAARIAARFPISEQRLLAWHYTNKTTPNLKFWQRSHEALLCLWRGDRPNLLVDQIRESYTPAHILQDGKERRSTPSRFAEDGAATVYAPHPGGALPRDIIAVPALAGGAGRAERWFLCRECDRRAFPPEQLDDHRSHDILKHPTQKPQVLSRRLILSVIAEGSAGRLLVPFAGSGSECVAARSLGVDFVGIEINPEFAELAGKWVAQTSPGLRANKEWPAASPTCVAPEAQASMF